MTDAFNNSWVCIGWVCLALDDTWWNMDMDEAYNAISRYVMLDTYSYDTQAAIYLDEFLLFFGFVNS